MVVVLSEDSFVDGNSLNGRELRHIADTARLLGCRVYSLPPNFEVCGTAETALAYVPVFEPLVCGIWVGYIPTIERYTAVFEAALTKGIRLINTPLEFQTALEFDRFYPLLGDLTPESVTFTAADDMTMVEAQLGFPVFVKGAVKSNKDKGWSACVAQNEDELTAIAQTLLGREQRSRGRIIARKLVKLRAIATDNQSFPLGREYRVFTYRDEVLSYGFYWEGCSDSWPLTHTEKVSIRSLALQATRRVGTPFMVVDVGQLESGEWIVIEVGDGQFAGMSQAPILELWSKLASIDPPALSEPAQSKVIAGNALL